MAKTRKRMKQHNMSNTSNLSGRLLALKFLRYCLTKKPMKTAEHSATWMGKTKYKQDLYNSFTDSRLLTILEKNVTPFTVKNKLLQINKSQNNKFTFVTTTSSGHLYSF